MEFELSSELLLSATLGNPCLTGTMGMLVLAAKLVPSDITSTLFKMTGKPELGWPKPPSTTGTSERLETPSLLGWPESLNLLLWVVLLVLLDNMCLMDVTS